MSDNTELARDGIEHAHHAAVHEEDNTARHIAILIAALAAMLAMAEMGERGAQNLFLTHHITSVDKWAFYQAKNVRSNLYAVTADVLESLPNSGDEAVRRRIEAAKTQAQRMLDDEQTVGRKQLGEQARHEEEKRDAQFERYEKLERVVGALQIAIVLASVSVVSRVRTLAFIAGAVGLAAGVYGLVVHFTSA
jgi:Domain of unknown function (DUF4337)